MHTHFQTNLYGDKAGLHLLSLTVARMNSDMKLDAVLELHRQRKLKDKKAIMTMVFKTAAPSHSSRSVEVSVCFVCACAYACACACAYACACLRCMCLCEYFVCGRLYMNSDLFACD